MNAKLSGYFPKLLFLSWGLYFIGLPSKGVIHTLSEIFILVFSLYSWRELGSTFIAHKKFFLSIISWVIPVILSFIYHFFVGEGQTFLLLEGLQMLFRALIVSGCLLLTFDSDSSRVNALLKIFLVAMLVHALSMFWQWYSGWDVTYRVYSVDRLSGSVFNPNPFGLFMAVAILVVYFKLVNGSQSWNRQLYIVLLFLFSVCLYKSQSRGAVLALLAAFAFSYIFSLNSKRKQVVVIFLLSVTVIIGMHQYGTIFGRGYFDALRWHVLMMALQQSFENFWFGIGVPGLLGLPLVEGANGPHNVFVDVALTTGWPTSLMFIFSSLWLIFHTRNAPGELAKTFRAVFFLVLTAGLFDYSIVASKMYLGLYVFSTAGLWWARKNDVQSIILSSG